MIPKRSAFLEKLHKHANPKDARFLQTFFKTGPGQYGEADLFIGVRIPAIRQMLPSSDGLPLTESEKMLHSKIHEERLLALMILVRQFQRGDDSLKKKIVSLYLDNTRWINNWDLVDQSAYHILGSWLLDKPRGLLKKLARSSLLWDRRIAVVCTYAFIRKGDLKNIFELSTMLLGDKEDLMHKACGWMLREAGKRDEKALCLFLDQHAAFMPRTMLRYALEKFPEAKRKEYLHRPCTAK
jgi:3-methyladenine DNA glycosylase AlkD